MENQMEKKMENEMETMLILCCIRVLPFKVRFNLEAKEVQNTMRYSGCRV